MILVDKFRKKTVGYYVEAAGMLVALVAFIVYIAYVASGGSSLAVVFIMAILGIALCAALYFYDGTFGELIALCVPICFIIAGAATIRSDYGNIVDKVNNIRMYGNPELADMTVLVTVLFAVACVISIVACFIKREKTED